MNRSPEPTAMLDLPSVAGRSHLGKTYRRCWVGAEAVGHLMARHALARHDRWVLLHRLMQFGLNDAR